MIEDVGTQPDMNTNVQWNQTKQGKSLSRFLLHIYYIVTHWLLYAIFYSLSTFYITQFLFSPSSPHLPRSYCTSCPSSPRKMISTSCSSISGAQRAWQMKKERTPRPPSGSAHAASGSLELNSAGVSPACFGYTNVPVSLNSTGG